MKYENASDLIPEALLKEIQKYAAGKLIYIPTGEGKKAWGESSGYREQLQRRNMMIRNKYNHGITVSELADEYFLSLDTIKKIIYSKSNNQELFYEPTIASAVNYAAAGLLEDWARCYVELSLRLNQLIVQEDPILFFGVVRLPLRLVSIAENIDNQHNEALYDQQSPLLIEYKDGKFLCPMQQNQLLGYKQQRKNTVPSIIFLNGNTEYKRFMKYYGNVFRYVSNEQ